MFGEFSDKLTYCSYVPSAKYLSHAFKLYAAMIKNHLEREVKKHGAKFLRWDVSYKEAKKLCRYHGHPVFKALVTATNELGEVRIQFHVVMDGHHQMVNAIKAFRETVLCYRQDMPELLFTDKPANDYNFFRGHLPSLVESEDKLNADAPGPLFSLWMEQFWIVNCDVDLDLDVWLIERVSDIDIVVYALHEHLSSQPEDKRVIGFDTEYEYGSKNQFPPKGHDKVATIQLAYTTNTGDLKCILVKCRHLVPKLRMSPRTGQSSTLERE